ncbi:MAG TPA: TonB-dependent receptor [Sphingobium sp.]|uniref:TonB-dependent receptor n=1 Tax=Sphingobium sp. TaxID=1912891 RepID=UPI002ED5A27B
MTRILSRLLTTSILAVGIAAPAMAQEAPSRSIDTGDIVVTARRVEERLQDVPISITVFNQEQLDKQNVFSTKDLANYAPSLTANTRYGSDFASFAIRGFTQEARTTTSVGVYFADAVVPRSSPLAAAGDGAGPGTLFDLQNVQVLKGPQGTLQGRNTTGGAVLLVPKRPTGRFEGYVEGSIGNYDMRRIQAVLNVPVSNSFRVRMGVDRQTHDGFLRNITGIGPNDFGDVDYTALRFSAVADLAPNLENYTVISYTQSKTNGSASKVTDCYLSGSAPIGTLNTRGPNELGCQQLNREKNAGDLTVTNWLPWAYQKTKTWQAVNTLKWQASDYLTIKNINSYGQVVQDQAQDLFGYFVPLGTTLKLPSSTAPYSTTVNVPPQYVGSAYGIDTSISPPGLHSGNQETFTQELQFQGTTPSGKLKYQAGLYYERSAPLSSAGSQSMAGVICANQQQWATFSCTDASAVTGAATATGARAYNVGKVNYRNMAVYGQATYNFTEKLSLDAGLRYTWDKSWGESQTLTAAYSAATGWNTPRFICNNPNLIYMNSVADCTENYSQSSNAPTWMIGLNYKPIEDVLLYAKYARGYRQGSISPIAAVGYKTYQPEHVDVYEAGFKASYNGAFKGYLNVSGFYNNFRDMQLQVSFVDTDPAPPSLPSGPAIVNAGKARIYGLEAEAMIQPFAGFTLQASYAYLNTKLLQFTQPIPTGGYNLVSSTPLQGSRLPFTPDQKLTVSATYVLPLEDKIGRVSLGATYIYTGTIYYGTDSSIARRVASIFDPSNGNYDTSYSPAYSLVNFNVGWQKIMDSSLDAQFFITNAFDKRYFDARSLSGSRGFTSRYYGEPQTYGVRLKYSF